jgi:K+-sensing histidine kinase KdpD
MARAREAGAGPQVEERELRNGLSNARAEVQRLRAEVQRLRADGKHRQAELAIVNEIIHSLARQRDFGQIVEAVGERAAAALAVRGMSISTVDPATGELTFHFWIDEGVRNYEMEGIKLGDSLSAEILRTNRAVRIGTADEAAARGTPFKIAGTESYLGVPIPAGDRAIGVFALGTHEKHAYSEADERLVTTMATAMGVALDNARVAANTRQRVAELAIVNEVNQAVGAQLGPDAVIELVGDRVRETFGADIAYVALREESGNTIGFPYYSDNGNRKPPASISDADGWTSRILATGQPLRVGALQDGETVEPDLPGAPARSYLGVPIRVGDDSIGVLAVGSTRDEDAFDDADQQLLSTIAAGVGVAIQNAELYAETRRLLAETNQRVVELEIVNEVGRALASQLDFGAIVEAVGDRTAVALGVRGLSISIVDPLTDELTFFYWIDEGVRRSTMERIVLGDSLSAEILRTNRAVRIGSAEEAAARGTPFKIGGTESYVGVPIPTGDKAIGVFAIGTRETQAYSESEERILATLASTMGVALQNARLVEETRQRAAELATINEVGQAVAAQLDLETLIELVGEKIGKTFTAADVVYLALYDAVTTRIKFPYYAEDGTRRPQADLQHGEGLTSRILDSREALLLNRSEQFEEVGTRGLGREARSYLGVPIVVGEQAIGVISVQSSTEEGMFDEADRRLLSTLAANVGTAIQKARLFTEMEQAKEAAEAANEAKSTFLASVSHELRTPLTSVLGFAKVIRRQLEERILPSVDAGDERTQRAIKQVRDNVDVIVTEGQRLTTLVNNVLDLAKIEAGRFEWHMEPVSMAEVADRAMTATASLFESSDLELRREIPDDLPQIVADRDGLMQVIINLLSNAVKFTEKGSVTCRARSTDEGIVVSVSDTGIGIVPADQARVFDKFTQVGDTLTDKPHGTGLGLPICREIVESHGGRIWVESEPGAGSTFSFVLPVAPVVPNAPGEAAAEAVG